MKTILPMLLADFYKISHKKFYDTESAIIYSTWTSRKSRLKNVNKVVCFGLQGFIKKYLIDYFNEYFFNQPIKDVVKEYKRILDNTIGGNIETDYIEDLHKLGYLPIKICALPEGTLTPIRVPMFTIENTIPEFYWVTNFLETLMSCEIWKPMTSATIALQYRKICEEWAEKTCDNKDHIPFQCHDFSMRGLTSVECACTSGAGHLTVFKGTDTIPAVCYLEHYYNADVQKELVGTSIPATEHSIMELNSYGKEDDEYDAFYRIINQVHPTGTVSIVSDTWNLWEILIRTLPQLKDKIMSRNGKVVIRPDSGDPCDIICGLNTKQSDVEVCSRHVHQIAGRVENNLYDMINWDNITHDLPVKGVQLTRYEYHEQSGQISYELVPEENQEYAEQRYKGVIELLWEVFGGTINSKGYKVLDPHIGCIYGDAITLERAEEICRRLESKGFASSNIVFGIGSYTYNMNTRDTFGFALKTTYGVVNGKELMLYKDPITDDGTKKSQKGMVAVYEKDGNLTYKDNLNKAQKASFKNDLLKPLFEDGKLLRETSLSEIREKLQNELRKEINQKNV